MFFRVFRCSIIECLLVIGYWLLRVESWELKIPNSTSSMWMATTRSPICAATRTINRSHLNIVVPNEVESVSFTSYFICQTLRLVTYQSHKQALFFSILHFNTTWIVTYQSHKIKPYFYRTILLSVTYQSHKNNSVNQRVIIAFLLDCHISVT